MPEQGENTERETVFVQPTEAGQAYRLVRGVGWAFFTGSGIFGIREPVDLNPGEYELVCLDMPGLEGPVSIIRSLNSAENDSPIEYFCVPRCWVSEVTLST